MQGHVIPSRSEGSGRRLLRGHRPDSSRSTALGMTAVLLLVAAAAAAQVQETITVERILIDARVTDGAGEPMLNLKPADFRVKIDGKRATVESVEWIPETAAARELANIDRPEVQPNLTMDEPAPRGRLLVFFFQTDPAREPSRVPGQQRMIHFSDQMIDMIEMDDRVAVFSFDSHLKFLSDFTDDKPRIRNAFRDSLLTSEPAGKPPVVPMPSMARYLDPDAMKKAASAEMGLFLVGNALRNIPGPKSLILVGYGLGRFGSGGVSLGKDYLVARRALEAARVSVFSLDISDADFHSLEVGLGAVSADTGGFYAKTHHFPQLAMDRLQRTLQGHYELEVRKPDTNIRGLHQIEVDVAKRDARVMARTSYLDRVDVQ